MGPYRQIAKIDQYNDKPIHNRKLASRLVGRTLLLVGKMMMILLFGLILIVGLSTRMLKLQ